MAVRARATPIRGQKPAEEAPQASRPAPTMPATPPIEGAGLHGVEPLMVASMPSLASGADVYYRQFYRGSKVPYRRYLPINLQ